MKNIFSFLILFLFFSSFAFAQWSNDPANPLAVCTAANIQATVHTVADNNGGSFVFWIDKRDAVAGTAIFGQHIDADGNLLWPVDGKAIYQTTGKNINDFKMVAWQNGILLAWIQVSTVYADSLRCQYFNLSGNPVWAQPVTVATATGSIIGIGGSAAFNIFPNQLGATIAYYYTYAGGADFFCFNRIDFSGNLAFPYNNFAITYGGYYDYRSCDDHQNGVYVLMKGNGIGSGIVVQRYDESGAAIFSIPVDITTTAGGFNGYITMISDTTGLLYVVWDSYGGNGVVATKLNPDGSFAWSPNYRDVSDYPSSQSYSNAILLNDHLYVAWDDNRPSASNAYIYVQKLSSSGVIEWNPGGVQACNLGSYIPVPKLVASDSGSVVVAYEVSAGFLAQKFMPDSSIKYAVNGDTISPLENSPFYGDYELQGGNGGCTAAFWSNEAGDIFGGSLCTQQANVGVLEISADEIPVTIFPNPSASGIFEIKLSQPVSAINVFDLMGRRIMSAENPNTSFKLDLSSAAIGAYLLEVTTKEGTITKKLQVE